MTGRGARRPLLVASTALIATAVYEMGWMTATMADGLSGREKLLAPLLASPGEAVPAMLGLVLAALAGGRSRVVAVIGFVLAAWVAAGAAAPWAWNALSDGTDVTPTGTTVSTVVVALLSGAALAALSLVVLRSTPAVGGADTADEAS